MRCASRGDSIGLEVMPWDEEDAFLPVHAYMFATAGAQIIEVVDMEEIAAEKQYEFAFLGFPMKLRGATGAPMPSYAVPLGRALEHVERQERGDDRIRDVHDLGQPEVDDRAAERVGRLGHEPARRDEVVDHREQRLARRHGEIHRVVDRDPVVANERRPGRAGSLVGREARLRR